MSKSFQEAVLAQSSKPAEGREPRPDPATPTSPMRKVVAVLVYWRCTGWSVVS